MKKITSLFMALLSVAFLFCACDQVAVAKEGDFVMIGVSEDFTGEVLLSDYMEQIKGSKSLVSFKIKNGMLTEINGIKASGRVYWMLYTDDADNSSSDWGTIEIDGITYASASAGAEGIIVSPGSTYVWYAKAF